MTNENIKTTIRLHIEHKEVDALKEVLNKTDRADLVQVLEELSPEEFGITYRLLNKDTALFVFEQLDVEQQQSLLTSFTHETAVEMITELEPDDRVRLLDELPAAVAKRLISGLSAEERELTNLLLGYAEETAGRIMTPEYVRLSKSMQIGEALKKVKENGQDKETIYTLFVTDDERRLEGVVSLRDLFMAMNPTETLETMMQEKPQSVTTDTDQEEAANVLQEFDLLALPVVDKENRLVGIVTFDDAMDILQDETTEDMYKSVGILTKTKDSQTQTTEETRSNTLINGNLWSILRLRIPILVFVLVGGFFSGMIVGGFEETLEAATMIAFFIPLIMDMGGSVGGQSTTVFARGFVLGQIKAGEFLRQLGKEALVGLMIGVVVGIFSFIGVNIWIGDMGVALAVSLALVVNCLIAASAGFLVPFILIKTGFDQATGSGPIITSIKDITGLIVYFLLVVAFVNLDAHAMTPYEAIHYSVDALQNLQEYAYPELSQSTMNAVEALKHTLSGY